MLYGLAALSVQLPLGMFISNTWFVNDNFLKRNVGLKLDFQKSTPREACGHVDLVHLGTHKQNSLCLSTPTELGRHKRHGLGYS